MEVSLSTGSYSVTSALLSSSVSVLALSLSLLSEKELRSVLSVSAASVSVTGS